MAEPRTTSAASARLRREGRSWYSRGNLDLRGETASATSAAHATLRYTAELPKVNLDAFALIAELSLGLLGFSGVAAAFGGRERAFNYVERVRLMGVVAHSSFPLFGSLVIYVLAEAGCAPAVSVSSAAAAALAVFLLYCFASVPKVMRSRRDVNTSTETWAVAIVWVQLAVAVSLYATAILMGGATWPLLAAYCAHLAMGTFVFWRILVRAG